MAVRPVTTVIGLCAGVGGLELGILLGEHLRGGLDALAHRIERLRAIGNGVDPVVGATAWLRLGALLDADRAERAGTATVSVLA